MNVRTCMMKKFKLTAYGKNDPSDLVLCHEKLAYFALIVHLGCMKLSLKQISNTDICGRERKRRGQNKIMCMK